MVNLGFELAAALPGLRSQAVSRMTETVTAGTFTDGVDPATGAPIRVPADERYAGIGRVRYPTSTVSDRDGTGQVVQSQDLILSIPTGSARLFEGDEVLVVSSSADDLLVGRRYQIAGSAQAGQTTAHRYPLTELS